MENNAIRERELRQSLKKKRSERQKEEKQGKKIKRCSVFWMIWGSINPENKKE